MLLVSVGVAETAGLGAVTGDACIIIGEETERFHIMMQN
jgi:hypothetical protein